MNFSETIRVLEKMKRYLSEKKQDGNINKDLIRAEINAIENIVNFTNLVLNNFPKSVVQKLINTDTVKNSSMIKEIIDKQNSKTDENYENIHVDEISIKPNHKLSFSIIKHNDKKYIILEPKKLDENASNWENWESFKFPVEILKESQTTRKIREINSPVSLTETV
jgi:hypothetical protein